MIPMLASHIASYYVWYLKHIWLVIYFNISSGMVYKLGSPRVYLLRILLPIRIRESSFDSTIMLICTGFILWGQIILLDGIMMLGLCILDALINPTHLSLPVIHDLHIGTLYIAVPGSFNLTSPDLIIFCIFIISKFSNMKCHNNNISYALDMFSFFLIGRDKSADIIDLLISLVKA